MATEQNTDLDGIRGWLVLVVIGWIFTPVQTSLILHDLYRSVISNDVWRELTTPGSEFYSALWMPALAIGTVGNLALSITAIIALSFMLKRSKYTPAVAISWFSFNFLLVVADYAIASRLPGFADQPFADFDAVKELVRAGLMAVVWIPYFIISKRVRTTFKREWPHSSVKPIPRRGAA